MILDSGICTVFHPTDRATAGEMPQKTYMPIWASWFGRLGYETAPAHPTEGRQELRVDARIRIYQCARVTQNDVVVLRHLSSFSEVTAQDTVYRVVRAWHGDDDSGPAPISDLSLEVFEP